jgi:hypothetical protein
MVTALVGVTMLAGLAFGVAAQEISPVPVNPPTCYVPGHDLNGDGRVNELDMNRWKDLLFRSGESCKLGVEAADCPPGLDINGDGIVTFDDLNIMLARYRECVMAPRSHTGPR